MNGNGWQTFMRMANLYNPQQMDSGMPTELPVGPTQPQLINRAGPGISTPGIYGGQTPDEILTAEVEQEPMSTLEAFRQNVLNPPQRQHMTYPKNTLAGLTEALKIAATPTDYEKNRVFVDGQAHQQVRAFKDPNTGQVRFINKYKQPGFAEQVMKAMPAAVSPAVDILNQPYQDAVSDWELRNKGFKEAIGAESALALAQQRQAQAGYTGQRADIERDKIAVSRMTAEERIRASQLNTLTDAEKIQMLQDGRMSLAEYQAAEALKRVEAQQAGATERTQIQQTGANQRTAAQQTGANQRTQAIIAAANQRNRERIAAGRTGGGGLSPSQNRVDMQRRAAEVINQNPEFDQYIIWDNQGFPTISPEAPPEAAEWIYGRLYSQSGDVNLPAERPTAPPQATTPQATTPPPTQPATKQPAKVPVPPPKQQGVQPIIQRSKSNPNQYRISYDGGKTWRSYNPFGKQ